MVAESATALCTSRRKHGDALTREDVVEYRKHKAREDLAVTDPERHLGLMVSRLEVRIPKLYGVRRNASGMRAYCASCNSRRCI